MLITPQGAGRRNAILATRNSYMTLLGLMPAPRSDAKPRKVLLLGQDESWACGEDRITRAKLKVMLIDLLRQEGSATTSLLAQATGVSSARVLTALKTMKAAGIVGLTERQAGIIVVKQWHLLKAGA